MDKPNILTERGLVDYIKSFFKKTKLSKKEKDKIKKEMQTSADKMNKNVADIEKSLNQMKRERDPKAPKVKLPRYKASDWYTK